MVSTLATILITVVAFALMWIMTQKCKLPKYQTTKNKRFESYVSDIEKKKMSPSASVED